MRQRTSEDVQSAVKTFSLSTLITASRAFLAFSLFFLIVKDEYSFALSIFLLGVASDFLDGHIARKRGEDSSLGGFFDHSCDALFVTTGFLALAISGSETYFLIGLIPISFIEYSWDFITNRTPLTPTFIGRFNGISYYVLIGIWLGVKALDAEISFEFENVLVFCARFLCFTTLFSIFVGIQNRIAVKF